MSPAGHYPTDVSEAQWEALQLLLPPPKWRPGRTRAPAHGPPPCHQGHFLWEQDGVPMAQDAHGYRQWTHDLWLLSPLAADGGLGACDGAATPVGTAEPGTSPRAVRVLCG